MHKAIFLVVFGLVSNIANAQTPLDLVKSQYTKTFYDEFDYPDKITPAPSWTPGTTAGQVFSANWNDNDGGNWHATSSGVDITTEYYVPNQISLTGGGTLKITENLLPYVHVNTYGRHYDHVSGVLFSRKVVSYGIIEARLKLPDGGWPSFWTEPHAVPQTTEIDIFDNSSSATSASNYGGHVIMPHTIDHSCGKGNGPGYYQLGTDMTSDGIVIPDDLTTNFHLYSAVWTPEYVDYYFDGHPIGRVDYTTVRTYPGQYRLEFSLGTYPCFSTLRNPSSPPCTPDGLYMEIDNVTTWELKCDNLSFSLLAPNNSDPLDYHYPQIGPGEFKKKDVIINVTGFPSPTFDPVYPPQNSATVIEAESTILGQDFISDESIISPIDDTDAVNDSRIANGYFEVRASKCIQYQERDSDGETGSNSQARHFTVRDTSLPASYSSLTSNIDIFPNPTNKGATICFDLPFQSNVSIRITDGLGKEFACVEPFDTVRRSGRQKMEINTSQLTPGIYYVRVQIDEQVVVKKLTVL